MKNFIYFFACFIFLGNCKAQKVYDKQPPKPKHDYARFDENNDACSRVEIGLGFLEHYISTVEDEDDKIQEWVLKYSQTSKAFKEAYQSYFNSRIYIDADPILLAQDIPSSLYLADIQDEFLVIKDDYWKDYINYLVVKDCKVTGVGNINIVVPRGLRNKYISEDLIEDEIKAIRKLYANINANLDTYEVTEYETDESTEGGYNKFYIKDNRFVKIELMYWGEMGNRRLEYYLDDMMGPRFVFEQLAHYNAPIYMTEVSEDGMQPYDESKTIVEENRYYFYNGHMIKWIDKDKLSVDRTSDRFVQKDNEMIDRMIEWQ